MLVALIHSVLMTIAAISSRQQNKKARYMFVLMMLGLISTLGELALFHEKLWDLYVLFISLSGPLIVSIPIFFYLFLRASLRFDDQLNLNDIKHFVVPFIYIIIMMPYNLLDLTARKEFFCDVYLEASSEWFLSCDSYVRGTVSWYLSLTPVRFTRLGLLVILGVFYLQLIKHEFNVQLNQKKFDVISAIKKLKVFFRAMCIGFGAIFVFFAFRLPHEFTWLLSSAVILLVLFMSMVFVYLPMLGRHNWTRYSVTTKTMLKNTFNRLTLDRIQAPFNNKKYRSSITPSISDKINAGINMLFEEGIYKDSTLSLKSLAFELEVSTHHLSQVINETTGGNYFDLVNKYRINEAKRLIHETDFKMIDIAYEVGFNSKSTFYAEFKSRTEKTPSQYKNSILGN